MLEGQKKQVSDRWFSVSFARDMAAELWKIATGEPLLRVVHLGVPQQMSRHEIAKMAGGHVVACSHDDFPGIAPRPIDTTYAGDAIFKDSVTVGIGWCIREHQERKVIGELQRARELSIFLGRPLDWCKEKLFRGFGPLHQAVAEDFRAANPQSDDELLNWYRTTEAYIWELSAYHSNSAFNYMGMCQGIAERLSTCGVKRVLCLGDGIGDLTLALWRAGV